MKISNSFFLDPIRYYRNNCFTIEICFNHVAEQKIYQTKYTKWNRRFITESGNYKLISKVTKEL